MSAKDDALALATLGWPVFKCKPSKAPATPGSWKEAASTDPASIRRMGWRADSLVGVALPPGTWALDVDDEAEWAKSGIELGQPTQATPGGGRHHLFGGQAPQTVKRLPGADTRNGGSGYVVCYDPAGWRSPDHLNLAPRELIAALSEAAKKRAPTPGEVMGTRDQIVAYTGRLRFAGATENEMRSALLQARDDGRIVALDEGRPWADEHLAAIARDIGSKPTGDWVAKPLRVRFVDKAGNVTRELVLANERDPLIAPRLDAANLELIRARDLLAMDLPPLVETVPGLLVEGLNLLVGAPKIGKSWLAYQCAVAVAVGGDVLGRQALKGDVLYLALEDGERRAQSRIRTILRRLGLAALPTDAAELDIRFLPTRGDDMVALVEAWLSLHPRAALVEIDTLQKVRPASSGRRNQYELDVEDVGRVLAIAQRHPGLAVGVVHHDRKERGEDFVDAASGTHGISGSVDTLAVIRRRRHEREGTLEVTGRDIPESLMHVAYDDDDPLWVLDPLGGLTEEQREAYAWLGANGPAGAKAMADGLGRERTSTQKLLDRMVEAGYLTKTGGTFSVPFRVNKRPKED